MTNVLFEAISSDGEIRRLTTILSQMQTKAAHFRELCAQRNKLYTESQKKSLRASVFRAGNQNRFITDAYIPHEKIIELIIKDMSDRIESIHNEIVDLAKELIV